MLKIQNLSVSVENKQIVRGVSLSIGPGEIHALMGPNGSGKSSLAMAVVGHPAYKVKSSKLKVKSSPEQNSKILLDGEDITDKTPDERARAGLFLAMQYPVGIGGVTVEQLLRRSFQELSKGRTLPATPPPAGRVGAGGPRQGPTLSDTSKLDVLKFRKDLEKLAEKVGVNRELLRRSLNVGFSGGEKKRLEILQMLVLKPKYAILDETDSGLDIDALRTIANSIRLFANSNLKSQISNPQLKTQNRPGILVITHYARLLHHLKPDFVHIMKEGKITETGGKELAERIERNGYR